ncbi:MAG: glycogen/starch/alpha-glucan phosphorylase [Eubacteriales bacterium]|nr:glycogen/starch/alpha-glucan phosphorylase [Eubacteriales bacterium]MDD3882644.1 glycogen/starch/alpha-glucan phosphorylase [Eubacteriales bacterium]MDD4512783.1 glycogen/starch/alpha-glucan phosphorylase [Eubacteriales bacterium]
MPTTNFDTEGIKQSIIGKLQRYNGRTIEEATPQQIYRAVASTVRDHIMQKWMETREERKRERSKRLYYLSVEFLMGRSLHSNILNLCHSDEYSEAFRELNINLGDILKEEPEPGLGNGGLGRLAACFMDSLSTLDLPAMGCSIRYEYGLFRQRIVDGQQVEVPDNWLENGNVWEMCVMQDACEVHFGGHVETEERDGRTYFKLVDYSSVEAIPYDMPVLGYNTDEVNTLRLWSARSPKKIDLSSFARGDYVKASEEMELAEIISKVLYPEDTHLEGKRLRLSQHYFFTSATLQYAIKDFKRVYGRNFDLLPDKAVFHINDTHPSLAIPELMRILMDEEGLGWDEAESIVRRSMAYTNHTVMAEALERWPEALMQTVLPRIYQILQEINRRVCDSLWQKFPGDWDKIAHMAVIAYGQVHMANLCVAWAYSVNGVSQLHGEILKKDTFHDYYRVFPTKFSAITNGITHRRWLMLANPELTALLDDAIGKKWHDDAAYLADLTPFAKDAAFRESFDKVKRMNKERLAKSFAEIEGVTVDPDFIFDVQAKRLHEYKRQMLNALHLHVVFNRIVDDENYEIEPHLMVFGAKASPGYRRAKLIIRYINALADKIRKHPRASKMLQVVFLENYNVSRAEILIPAAEISQQLSTAGKEASGTGNMKFMMNGALTVGTMDGANVEMSQQVGMDNIYIFGMRSAEVDNLYRSGSYSAASIFETNHEIRRAMTEMIDGTLFPENPATLQELYHALLFGDNGGMADPYLVLKDFGSYSMAMRRVNRDYADRQKWLEMAVMNTASSGAFSSDRTIREYNDTIWHLTPLTLDK